jgi:tetratricopeptide (TPR) repeat protein
MLLLLARNLSRQMGLKAVFCLIGIPLLGWVPTLVAQQKQDSESQSAQQDTKSATASEAEVALQAAIKDWEANPNDPDKLIWVGRRLAYLGRYQESIETFSLGVEKFPQDARFLRHRGHRWITLREFEKAVDDFEAAAKLIEGLEDQVEPDGQPNAAGIPTSTLHTNIWYHLGVAKFLLGDFERALDAYEKCLPASNNPDMRVATLDWQYMTLCRLERRDEADRIIAEVTPEWPIIENHAYHRRLLMYQGKLQATDLLPSLTATDQNRMDEVVSSSSPGVELATYGFGVGHWYLIQGDRQKAREIFEAVVSGSSPAAFGYIAAEVELKRMGDDSR